MPLQPGTRLGPYTVIAKLGEGGMGEVWQARDTKLDRDVALKVLLPEHVASDPDLKQRFEREAKTISSLNHQHICTLYASPARSHASATRHLTRPVPDRRPPRRGGHGRGLQSHRHQAQPAGGAQDPPRVTKQANYSRPGSFNGSMHPLRSKARVNEAADSHA